MSCLRGVVGRKTSKVVEPIFVIDGIQIQLRIKTHYVLVASYVKKTQQLLYVTDSTATCCMLCLLVGLACLL